MTLSWLDREFASAFIVNDDDDDFGEVNLPEGEGEEESEEDEAEETGADAEDGDDAVATAKAWLGQTALQKALGGPV